jgi:hypothetical protein
MMTVSAMELTPNESLAVFAAETIALLHQLVEQYPYRLVALPDLSHRRPRPGPRRFDGSELDRLHTLLRAAQAIAVGLRKLRTRRLARSKILPFMRARAGSKFALESNIQYRLGLSEPLIGWVGHKSRSPPDSVCGSLSSPPKECSRTGSTLLWMLAAG